MKDAFDQWWEWANKPFSDMATIPAEIHQPVMALPPEDRDECQSHHAAGGSGEGRCGAVAAEHSRTPLRLPRRKLGNQRQPDRRRDAVVKSDLADAAEQQGLDEIRVVRSRPWLLGELHVEL